MRSHVRATVALLTVAGVLAGAAGAYAATGGGTAKAHVHHSMSTKNCPNMGGANSQ